VNLSLRKKIVLVFSAGLMLVTVILVASFSNEVSSRYRDLLLERGNNIADQLVFKTEKLLELGLYPEEFNGYEKILQSTANSTEGILSIALTDKSGKVCFQVTLDANGSYQIVTPIKNQYFPPKDDRLIVRKSVDGTLPNQAYVIVVMDKAFIAQNTQAFARTTVIYSAFISLLSIVCILIFLRVHLGQPLTLLVEQIQTLDLEDNDKININLTNRKDEIGIVANSFEDLVIRLSNNRKALAKTNDELLLLTEELEFRVSIRTQELQRANEKLESIAHIDFLTGLSNRHSLKEILDPRFDQAKHGDYNFAILMLDLDGFKTINDFYGHAAGDVVLGVIGLRIRLSLPNNDNIFRYGGDEFVFILEAYEGRDQLITTIEKIRSVILQPISFSGEELPFGLSIGVASSEHFGFSSAEKLLQLADTAMYEAKRNKLGYFILENGSG
jgi:diguanylate cyclase (GGDEF)-like protein